MSLTLLFNQGGDQDIYSSDSGMGEEALGSRTFGSRESGTGTDVMNELLASLQKSDSGVGTDVISNLLAEIIQSDSGAGVDAKKLLSVYIRLKLLQAKKEVNIKLYKIKGKKKKK